MSTLIKLIIATCIVSYIYLRLTEYIMCLQCSPGWVRTQMGTYAATRTPDKGIYTSLWCAYYVSHLYALCTNGIVL